MVALRAMDLPSIQITALQSTLRARSTRAPSSIHLPVSPITMTPDPFSLRSSCMALLLAACTLLSACGGGDGTPAGASQAAGTSNTVHAQSLTSRNAAPTVSITSPPNGAVTSSSSITVSGLASDDQGVHSVTFTANGVTAYATLDAPNSHYTNY